MNVSIPRQKLESCQCNPAVCTGYHKRMAFEAFGGCPIDLPGVGDRIGALAIVGPPRKPGVFDRRNQRHLCLYRSSGVTIDPCDGKREGGRTYRSDFFRGHGSEVYADFVDAADEVARNAPNDRLRGRSDRGDWIGCVLGDQHTVHIKFCEAGS